MAERGSTTVRSVLEVVALGDTPGDPDRSAAASRAVRKALVRWAQERWPDSRFDEDGFRLLHGESGALELVSYDREAGGDDVAAALHEVKLSVSHSRDSACGLVVWEERGDG